MTVRTPDDTGEAVASWPGVRVSIRTRLTIWYSLVVFVALVSAGASVLWLQAHLGLARVDQELEAATVTVAGVLRNELDEGLNLDESVRDMMAELNLTGEGFAVVTSAGALIGSKVAQGPALPSTVVQTAGPTPLTVPSGADGARVRAAPLVYRGHALRIVAWKSLSPLQAERRTLERALLLGIPLAVLFSIVGGLSIGRRALRPLGEMAGQAGRVGSDLRSRLSASNPTDELGTLAHAFNGLLDRLAASLQQQRTFMADASHQLRTPVSVIRTAAQVMLSRERRSEAEYRESLDVVARQARRLTKMVDDMFVLALADAGARPLQVAPLYLDEVVGEVVDDLRLLAKTHLVTLRNESAGEAPFVGDEELLRQLLTNLLDNAIRHTPHQGTVTVSLTRTKGTLSVTVTDTGPGIAPGDVDRIFGRFIRLDPPGADTGGGLGLPIARWIAEAHGGSVVLSSTGPDGSQFLVTLPTDQRNPSQVASRSDVAIPDQPVAVAHHAPRSNLTA